MQTSFFRPTTEGRVNRTTFLAYTFMYSLIILVLALLFQNLRPEFGAILAPAISVVWVVYYFSIGIRRAHDIGRNGWFVLLLLVPLANLVLYFWAGSEGENEYGPQPPRSPVGLIVVAVASFAPFFFGLLFMVPRDKSDDVWQANCNFIVHQEWNGTTFSNGEICWEAAEMHFEEYRGERNNLGEGHSSGCKLVKTSFPLSLILFAIDAR